MKLLTAKAGLWLMTMAVGGTTVVAAQISPVKAFSAARVNSGRLAIVSVAGAVPVSDEQSAIETSASSLPDAPSAVAATQLAQEPAPVAAQPVQAAPRPVANSTLGATFLIANGMLLGSTIANAEMIGRCQPSSCQSVPDAIRNRGDLYAIGIPASLGVSYISYRLKRAGTRFWLLPVAVFTAGNVVYAVHASHFSSH